MRIAFIVSRFPCRSETFIFNQITGLLDRGHDVWIFADRMESNGNEFPEFEKYDLANRTVYFQNDGKLGMPRNIVFRFLKAFMLRHDKWRNRKKSFIQAINPIRFGKMAASLVLFYKGTSFLDHNPFDIIHCHFGLNGRVAVALKEIGVLHGKVITSFYGYDVAKYVKENGRGIYKELFSYGDLIATVTMRMKMKLVDLGCPPEKIIVHRTGINMERFSYCGEPKKENGLLRILSVGRFVEKKGFEYAVRAVAEAMKRYPNIEYRIVGDGILKKDIQQLVDQLDIENRIQFLGWRPPSEIATLMAESDIFLAPSVTDPNGDEEGLPAAIIEAVGCGVPVLSTWHSGIPEVVQEGKVGLLAPERNAEALAEKLEVLISNSEIRTKMGKVGRALVEEQYDIGKLNDHLVEVYESMLEEKEGSIKPLSNESINKMEALLKKSSATVIQS